jgi:hypothetical protein
MAIIKLFSDNPIDGITTFDKVRFYEATDSAGTGATLIATEDIDTDTIDMIGPGFTDYVYTAGSTSKYYASAWYNSSNGALSAYSTWVLGGLDRWDTMFMAELKDTSSAVWDATDRGYFKSKALEALYPDFFRNVVDTSLTIVNNSTLQTYVYTVPYGIFYIAEVGVGNLNKTASLTRTFEKVKADYWTFEKNQLHFSSLSGLTDGETIRLIASKKYLEVGEVPDRLNPLVMEHMRMSAYLQMADDFPRFKTWGKLQQGTKVSFENLRVHAREFERRFNDLKKELKDSHYATLS